MSFMLSLGGVGFAVLTDNTFDRKENDRAITDFTLKI